MRTGLPKSSVAPRRANITIPRCQSRAAAPRPRERSRHPHITALIVAERRHSAITRYAERSAAQRAGTRHAPAVGVPEVRHYSRAGVRPRKRSRHPHITAHIVAERRHSAVTRYAERSAVCRDSTRPCCRRAGGTPLLQSRSQTARAVTPSVNPRQRRGHTHRRRCAADAPPRTRQGQPSVQKNPPAEAEGFKSISVVWII